MTPAERAQHIVDAAEALVEGKVQTLAERYSGEDEVRVIHTYVRPGMEEHVAAAIFCRDFHEGYLYPIIDYEVVDTDGKFSFTVLWYPDLASVYYKITD